MDLSFVPSETRNHFPALFLFPCFPQLHSSPFYTSPHGYRLRASLFPTGNGSGDGTHLSVYMRLVPGDYDPLLDWPFRSTVTVCLLDQCTDRLKRADIVESFAPSASWKQFQRPTTVTPNGAGDGEGGGGGAGNWFGYPRFVSLETLKTGSYVRDDVIFVKFKVEQQPKYIDR